ncbi:hypothetical protein [Microbacterium sp. C7(2022)]|uniref:hypothetical protein n=1 Tax=Microbacterium sp. C7(2022) TaxID=2992759 RepID=UPI00237C0A06|nr:hypothetical protein [Microbacterium sp. C7(2022)]MDE0546550.1 hypothetical protein [Microbacterium sp. C7(2022)]
MVTMLLDSTRLEVVLSVTERALAFRKTNVVIERSAITKVQLVDDAWTWLRGVASPGTHLRAVVAMGTWQSAAGADFVIVRRHRAGVVIDLETHDEFERVVLTTRHGLELVQALRVNVATDEAPADVTALATGPITRPTRARSSQKAAPAV